MSESRFGRLALGSWQTLDRTPAEDSIAVLAEALAGGIRFFDVARYTPDNGGLGDDEATERAFARNLAATGAPRDELVISSKAWSDRRPEVDLRAEVEQSIERMGCGWLDLLYLDPPPEGVADDAVLDELAPLLADGTVRSWGLMAWTPERLATVDAAVASGRLTSPVALQLPYNVVWRQPLDSPPCEQFLERHRASVVASAPLAYGLLTGKYSGDDATGRMAADWPGLKDFLSPALHQFLEVAKDADVAPAHLALAFVLRHPRVGTALFGARTPEQVRANVAALGVADQVPDAVLDRVRAVPPVDAAAV